MYDHNESFQVPEGGVCNAFNSENQVQRKKRQAEVAKKVAAADKIDWNTVPETPLEVRVAEIVEDINDKTYVPTQVLKDTLERIHQRHHGDEPTTEQSAEVELIEQELRNRGEEGGYGA
jgi:hypothetical protein